jgi:hypothetical protein
MAKERSARRRTQRTGRGNGGQGTDTPYPVQFVQLKLVIENQSCGHFTRGTGIMKFATTAVFQRGWRMEDGICSDGREHSDGWNKNWECLPREGATSKMYGVFRFKFSVFSQLAGTIAKAGR